MQDLIKKLSNKRQANRLFKDIELTQFNRIIETLLELQEEKEKIAKLSAERLEKEHKELEKIRDHIVNNNLNFDKLAQLIKPKRRSQKMKKATRNLPQQTDNPDHEKTKTLPR